MHRWIVALELRRAYFRLHWQKSPLFTWTSRRSDSPSTTVSCNQWEHLCSQFDFNGGKYPTAINHLYTGDPLRGHFSKISNKLPKIKKLFCFWISVQFSIQCTVSAVTNFLNFFLNFFFSFFWIFFLNFVFDFFRILFFVFFIFFANWNVFSSFEVEDFLAVSVDFLNF
jgi:hypothetical protein